MFFIALLLNINATQTYLNESDQWQSNLTTVQFASLAFGDIDNDGDLDLALSGSGSNNVAKIYINNGSTLTENTTWQDNLTGVNLVQIFLPYGVILFAFSGSAAIPEMKEVSQTVINKMKIDLFMSKIEGFTLEQLEQFLQ